MKNIVNKLEGLNTILVSWFSLKANFKTARDSKIENKVDSEKKERLMKDLSEQEFEEFIIKSGAAGSFMVFRSDKKDEEMGLDEI